MKKARKKGVSVDAASGKISVKKTASKGKYKVKVKIQANKKYKGKTLLFTVRVK